MNGKVVLPDLSPYPPDLQELLLTSPTISALAKNFQQHIRQFNSAFSFASFGANIAAPPGNGPPCFRICGQICHRSGTLIQILVYHHLMVSYICTMAVKHYDIEWEMLLMKSAMKL